MPCPDKDRDTMQDPAGAGPGNVYHPTEKKRPSHVVEAMGGGRVMVRDLEVFIGYNPETDGDDSRFEKFDEATVREMVKKTGAMIARGQNPQLIVGHTPEDAMARGQVPSVGEFTAVRFDQDPDGAPMVVMDLEMGEGDFDAYLKSNSYPRRSAEIYGDGLIENVALLGAASPARPLPDTRFQRLERFSRDFQPADWIFQRAEGDSPMSDSSMADQLAAMTAERDKLRADLEAAQAAAAGDRDKFQKDRDATTERFQKLEESNGALRAELMVERFSRKIDEERHAGARIDNDLADQIIERCSKATDPEAEFEFLTKLVTRDPVNVPVLKYSRAATVPADTPSESKLDATAREMAVERCQKMQADGENPKFDTVLRQCRRELEMKETA